MLLSSSFATAQQISRYEGKVPLVTGDSATVRYEYYELKGQQRLHGNYQLQASTARQKDSLTFEKILWEGNYTNNQKAGSWKYEYQQHRVTIKEIQEFKINTTLHTDYNTLVARYLNGNPEGRWTYTRNHFTQGAKKRILKEASLRFSKGILTGLIDVNAPAGTGTPTLTGSLDENGFFHDAWKFTYTDDTLKVRETRMYEHGFLLSLIKEETGTGSKLIEVQFPDVRAKLNSESGAERSFGVDSTLHPLLFDVGYHATSRELTSQQAGNAILEQSINEILFLDTAFRAKDKRVYGSARFYHPPPKEEADEIYQIKTYLDSIQTEFSQIRNRKFLDLSSQHSDSLAWRYELIRRYPQRLTDVSALIEFIESPDFRYVDPAIYLAHHAAFLSGSDSLNYSFVGEQRKKVITWSASSVTSLADLKNRLKEELVEVRNTVSQINLELKTVLQSYQLNKLDSIILDTKSEADIVYQQVTDPVVKPYALIFQKRFLQAEFNRMKQTYANSDNFDDKLAIGYDILSFLEALQRFPEKIHQVYILRDSIDQLYTESTLDPYTFTYVKVKVKKKLYEKVAQELFLYMMRELSEALKAETVKKQLASIETLQKRLIAWRLQNTTQLEKQIKSKSSPEEIKKLIGI